jgi:hypothetical protein
MQHPAAHLPGAHQAGRRRLPRRSSTGSTTTAFGAVCRRAAAERLVGRSIESDRLRPPRGRPARSAPAAVRFISAGTSDRPAARLNLDGIDWLIIGGESGAGARPLSTAWVHDLLHGSRQAGTAPFVKQLGSVWARDTAWGGKTVHGHGDTKGGNPDYWPSRLRVREYPQTQQYAPAGQLLRDEEFEATWAGGHALVIEYGDCEMYGRCQCGKRFGMNTPDVSLDAFSTPWEQHVMGLHR